MHTLFDFITTVKAVEYVMAVTAIAGFILFWELLKEKPFKSLRDAGREDLKYVKENGVSLATLMSAPFAVIVYVSSLPLAFVSGLAAGLMNGLLKLAGGSAAFYWRPLAAYLSGRKKTKRPTAGRNKRHMGKNDVDNKPSAGGPASGKSGDGGVKAAPGETGDSLNFTRRRFMGLVAAVGGALGAAGLASKARTAGAREFEGYAGRYGVLYDLTECVGCRSCEEACNLENKLPAPETPFYDPSVFDGTRRPTVNAYTVVNRYPNPKDPDRPLYRKIQCNHCNEPACATACPIHAYTKTPEGPVTYDEDLCFGCRYCMVACPYYVPAYDYDSALEPRISKCTMCHHRVKQGRPTACSEACPTGALTFGKRDDLIRLARERIARDPDRYVDHIFGEAEAGGSSWLYISGVPFEHYGFPADIQKAAMLENTKGFLASVPLVFTIWPAFFGMLYQATQRRSGAKSEAEHEKREE